MSTHTRTCFWVERDGDRGQDKGWPEEGPFHFDTEQDAIAYVLGEDGMGWTRMPDGRLLCRGCSEDADCEVTGHQWTPWRPGITRAAIESGVEVRWRTHCPGGNEVGVYPIGDDVEVAR